MIMTSYKVNFILKNYQKNVEIRKNLRIYEKIKLILRRKSK
jgi:hypothetical protein